MASSGWTIVLVSTTKTALSAARPAAQTRRLMRRSYRSRTIGTRHTGDLDISKLAGRARAGNRKSGEPMSRKLNARAAGTAVASAHKVRIRLARAPRRRPGIKEKTRSLERYGQRLRQRPSPTTEPHMLYLRS